MGETTTARPSLKMIIRTLKWSGITVEGITDDGAGARLELGDGTIFNTHILEHMLGNAPRTKWRRIIEDFIRPAVEGPPDVPGIGEVELMKNTYSRLLWELPAEFGPGAYTYARKFGPFHEVLQMKMGQHLAYLSDLQVEGRDLDLLYDAARKNTEKLHCDIDLMAHPETGAMLWSFKGESNLVASKLPFVPAAIRRGTAGVSRAGEADAIGHGMLFAIPNRHEILATGLSAPCDLDSIELLMKFSADSADSTGMPGTWFMHWDDGAMEIEAVSYGKHPITGEMRLSDGAFRDAISNSRTSSRPTWTGGMIWTTGTTRRTPVADRRTTAKPRPRPRRSGTGRRLAEKRWPYPACSSMLPPGIESSSRRVYSSEGFSKSSSVRPVSTMRPFSITST